MMNFIFTNNPLPLNIKYDRNLEVDGMNSVILFEIRGNLLGYITSFHRLDISQNLEPVIKMFII